MAETAIFAIAERGSMMHDGRGKWYKNSSKHNAVNLDNAVKEKSYILFHSISNVLEERPSEGKKDFIWDIIGRFSSNQIKVIEALTRVRLNELAHIFTEHE
ncbi:hypothetical protein GLOIN_2v1838029 [Rhizophagus clarus]|uniref:Uncharacterized protein n=1 Tax=Rhizophagus clarus TaxID=94130 RepID=A0A8H3L4V4_9GLOM|nr:hypothetical protein GLOIN_2v1838029 [Rhizophagus clarus]